MMFLNNIDILYTLPSLYFFRGEMLVMDSHIYKSGSREHIQQIFDK